MKNGEIIADNLKKAGWSLGLVQLWILRAERFGGCRRAWRRKAFHRPWRRLFRT